MVFDYNKRMIKTSVNMKNNKFIKTHKIKNYRDLLEIIQGNSKFEDLRKDYIFRGLKKSCYDLVPSALRKDKKGIYEITKFIADSEFKLGLQTHYRQAVEEDFYGEKFEVTKENENCIIMDPINKHGRIIEGNYRTPFIRSASELQFKRETYVLLKFLNYCDRIGLRIQVSEKVRRWLHNFLRYQYEQETIWPEFEFFEIISLAQHYGLPTRALDWSYDYKIALYFAVEDALKKDSKDCVLWAFNYKLFENKYGVNKYYYEIPKLEIYRPEYNSNPNLNAQQGLFTFWPCTSDDNLLDDTSFDDLVINELKENTRIDKYDSTKTEYHKIEGYEGFIIPKNVKIFHKFIISSKLKVKILKELYAEGYTNEFIYPSYRGVVDSIRKEVELDEYLQNE